MEKFLPLFLSFCGGVLVSIVIYDILMNEYGHLLETGMSLTLLWCIAFSIYSLWRMIRKYHNYMIRKFRKQKETEKETSSVVIEVKNKTNGS